MTVFQDTELGVKTQGIVIVITVFSFLYLTFKFSKKSRLNYPGGPIGFPLLGYIPFLSKYFHLDFVELGKKYGDIFSVQLGSRLVVVLNTADVIREGYVKSEFQGRPQNNAFDILKRRSPFFGSDDHLWVEHRKLFVHTMKELGFTSNRMEEIMLEEITLFLNAVQRHEGRHIDPIIPLSSSVANNISFLIFNERPGCENTRRAKLHRNTDVITKMLGQTVYRIFFPWMQYIPLSMISKNYLEFTEALSEWKFFFIEKIHEHEVTLDPKNIRDFIDNYLVEMQNKKGKSTTLTYDELRASVGDIYGAGTETTRNTILWTLYAVAAYPAAQRRARAEVEAVIGEGRRPQYAHQARMPYTHAFILEVMRWKTVLPLSILRCTTEDTTLRGFDIPRGTILMANLWHAHHDPALWSEPDDFMPERFLTQDGLSVRKSNNFLNFSIGKRACPGEEMARMEVFLYFVSILQAFDVSFPSGYEPTFEGELGMTYQPRPFMVHFTPRNGQTK